MNISSYGKVRAFGHREVRNILDGNIVVQEKIDGSQFSFGVVGGKLCCRSSGQEIYIDNPEKMFAQAVAVVKTLEPLLPTGWVYRGEYLQKPKHNTLSYSRVPVNNIILFDVIMLDETYLTPGDLEIEARRLGLESVPCFYSGPGNIDGNAPIPFRDFLDRESILGGAKIEGIVIKNYSKFTEDGKLATAKIVSDEFKERHRGQWKVSNPGPNDLIQLIAAELRTDARYRKSVQHLRERGEIKFEPEDIGKLMRELGTDLHSEEAEHVKEILFKHFWPKIQRAACSGFPNWYKDIFLSEYYAEQYNTIR